MKKIDDKTRHLMRQAFEDAQKSWEKRPPDYFYPNFDDWLSETLVTGETREIELIAEAEKLNEV